MNQLTTSQIITLLNLSTTNSFKSTLRDITTLIQYDLIEVIDNEGYKLTSKGDVLKNNLINTTIIFLNK